MSTVGYGDVYCETVLGRTFLVFFLLVGLVSSTTTITTATLKKYNNTKKTIQLNIFKRTKYLSFLLVTHIDNIFSICLSLSRSLSIKNSLSLSLFVSARRHRDPLSLGECKQRGSQCYKMCEWFKFWLFA